MWRSHTAVSIALAHRALCAFVERNVEKHNNVSFLRTGSSRLKHECPETISLLHYLFFPAFLHFHHFFTLVF